MGIFSILGCLACSANSGDTTVHKKPQGTLEHTQKLGVSSQHPIDILPIFETVSQVGTKAFSTADLQHEMTALKEQIGQDGGMIKVGFSHIFQNIQSVRLQCKLSKANNLSVGLIIAVQSHTGGIPISVTTDFRRMQWRLDGKTWKGEVTKGASDTLEFPPRDWEVPTPSRYCTAVHDAALSRVYSEAKQIREVMNEYPGVIVVVNCSIEEELATGGADSPEYLGDYSPFAVTEFRDWLRHTGMYNDSTGKYAGQGAPSAIVGSFVYTGGKWRSPFYSERTPDAPIPGHKSFNETFGTHFTTWNLRYWDLKRYPGPITDPNFSPTPSSGDGFIQGGFDAPRDNDPSDPFWRAWSWDVPYEGGKEPPGNPADPAFGFRQCEVKHFVTDMLNEIARAGIPVNMIYAHQIPGEAVNAERCRSGADPVWTGYYKRGNTVGITRFGPIDPSLLTQYSHHWGIFEWHPAPNADPNSKALYDAATSALNTYYANGVRVLFPGWWSANGNITATFPLNNSQFAVALHNWISAHQNVK